MKLSYNVISVLKNFVSINSNIVFRPNEPIKTMSEAKNILAKASLPEFEVTQTFGIYDLNEFLGAISMFEDPDLEFKDNFVLISENGRSIKYFFSDPEILTSPTKDIVLPSEDVQFVLTESDLASIRRAASTLGVTDLIVSSEEGSETASLQITDIKDSTSNTYQMELSNVTLNKNDAFKFVFNVSNLKMIAGTYDVTISSKLISRFVETTSNLEYYIALEKSSTFEK
jgi:hypothetical protein